MARVSELQASDYWTGVRVGDTVFFRDPSEEGLSVYTASNDTWTLYPMFRLAIAAGWYTPAPDDGSYPEDVRGLALGGGTVWMGTNGLGVVAHDLSEGTWARYDVKATPLPGVHTFVLHADDDYVFVLSGGPSGGWERLPDVRSAEQLGPALEVLSLRRNAWLRVKAVPGDNVLAFGWTSPHASMSCDNRRLKGRPTVSLQLCTGIDYVAARAEGDGYEAGRNFGDEGSPFRVLIRRAELDAAFERAHKGLRGVRR